MVPDVVLVKQRALSCSPMLEGMVSGAVLTLSGEEGQREVDHGCVVDIDIDTYV